jgi:hypothetical protein
VTLDALVLILTAWLGAATAQSPLAPPPIVVVPAAQLHYRYCQTRSRQPLDDCLAERFNTASLFDSATGAIYLSQRFRATNPADRVSLVVQLARHAGESARLALGPAALFEGHESADSCAVHLEEASRELGRAYLLANGMQRDELPALEVADGMAPWSCRPAELARVAAPGT